MGKTVDNAERRIFRRRPGVRVALVLAGCLAMAPRVSAEVMDKEPTIAANWLYAVLGGFVVVLAWRWRWWLGTALSVLWLSGLWLIRQEITDPAIHAAIQREAGPRYFTHFYCSVAVALAFQAVAIYAGWRTRRA